MTKDEMKATLRLSAERGFALVHKKPRREADVVARLREALNAASNCGGPEHEAYYVLRDRVEDLIKELDS